MSLAARAFITGIDSFTGRYLSAELAGHGYEVFGTTRRASTAAGYEMCEINDQARLTEILRRVRPDFVFHLAAITVAEYGSSREIYTTNLLGTLSLLEAISASKIACRKVLLAGSAHVYGNQPRSPIGEDFSPMPTSDYAVSKLALEHLAKLWFGRLPLIVVRPFNFAGVGQGQNRLLPKIVDHFARRAPEIELGNTDVARDFSDVRDVVDSYRRLIESDAHSVIANVCSGVSYPLERILDLLSEISGHSLAVRVNSDFVRKNDVKALWGDNRLLDSLIGPVCYRPIKETLNWMYSDAVRALGDR